MTLTAIDFAFLFVTSTLGSACGLLLFIGFDMLSKRREAAKRKGRLS